MLFRWTRWLCGALVCALTILGTGALAETVRGDLSERFGMDTVLELEGVDYRLRKRMTSALVICVEHDETDALYIGYMGVLSADDHTKTFSLVELQPNLALLVGDDYASLEATFAVEEEMEICGLLTLQQVNALLSQEVVENYVVFDMAGLAQIEGLPEVDLTGVEPGGETKQRLKGVLAHVENFSTSELANLMNELSDYLETDMKSGTMMKLMDKAERYEILPTVHITGEPVTDEDGEEYLLIGADELNAILIGAFLEENPY